MTPQTIKILELLRCGDWICTSQMYALYIADPRTRIVELKKKGYLLEWRWCQSHSHNKSKEWRLVTPDVLFEKQVEMSHLEAPQTHHNARSEEFTPKTIYSSSNPQKPLFIYQIMPNH